MDKYDWRTAAVYAAIVAVILIRILYKNHVEKTIRKHISWCEVSGFGFEFCCPQSLWLSVNDIQNEQNVDEKYLILGDNSWCIVKDILSFYQKKLADFYFLRFYQTLGKGNSLKSLRNFANLSDMEFFMLSLDIFLEKYQTETVFNGSDMYNLLSRIDYGSWGAQLYDAEYELTDYALVYHKLYYIADLFCRRNDRIKKIGTSHHPEEIAKIIDTNRIKISRI